MENEKFVAINKKLELAKLKFEKINSLLIDVNESASKAIDRMNSISCELLYSRRRDANRMGETIKNVKAEINNSQFEQNEKFNLVYKNLSNQEIMLDYLKEENESYTQFEINLYIKKIKQNISNNETWYTPENNFTKIDFTNHGGLRGMIFTPIADYNRKSYELARQLYEVEVLMREIKTDVWNIELDKLEALKKPEILKEPEIVKIQLESEPLDEYQSSDILVESMSMLEATSESGISMESIRESAGVPLLICSCGGRGRTAFCM